MFVPETRAPQRGQNRLGSSERFVLLEVLPDRVNHVGTIVEPRQFVDKCLPALRPGVAAIERHVLGVDRFGVGTKVAFSPTRRANKGVIVRLYVVNVRTHLL